jgi:CBS domain containing-hemolysin-like protein
MSAFFSASEMAFVLSNKVKMEVKARKRRISAKYILHFAKRTDKFFSTILIGNNIAIIAFASVCTVLLQETFNEWVILIISTLGILILGELIPKFIARETADHLILLLAKPLRWSSLILAPAVRFTSWIALKITRQKKVDESVYAKYFEREAFNQLIRESEEAGTVSKSETTIINKVLQLKHQDVNESMRPRTEVTAVDIDTPIADVLSLFISSGYSKLPVYEGSIDHIKGVILAHDLFTNPDTVRSIMHEVIFVPEARKSIDMLNDFINQRISFAVVVDEFGGTAGIVTMEDIVEEFFGEIKDEYDIDEDICRRTSENTFVIAGKIEIDHINEKFGLELPKGDYETISGFITTQIGRIPVTGEEIAFGQYQVLILRATLVRIESVKLSINSE